MENYTPYGPEWVKEMMKMKKSDIIQFYRIALFKKDILSTPLPSTTNQDREARARIFLMENGFATLLPGSKVLEQAIKIAANTEEE